MEEQTLVSQSTRDRDLSMRTILLLSAISMLTLAGIRVPCASAETTCTVSGTDHRTGVLLSGICVLRGAPSDTPSDLSRQGPPTESVRCGRPGVAAIGSWDPRCGAPLSCYDVDPTTHRRVQLDAYATFIVVAGASVLQ